MMNISIKAQLHEAYGFWGDNFLSIFHVLGIMVSMATNTNEKWAKIYGWYKTFQGTFL